MPEVPPIPERPKVPARPKRRVTQQEWKHAEVLEQAKDRSLFELRGYEQIRSHGTSAEGDVSSVRTETRTFSNATVIHFTDVGYRPRDETAQAYSVYSRYSDLGYEGSGGETEVPSCRVSTGQRHFGVESPVGSVLEFEKFDENTKEDESLYQKQNFTPKNGIEFQPEVPQRPIRVSGPLCEISDASVIRSSNAASGEQVHSAASVYRKEIKLVPPKPDSPTEDILGGEYNSKGSVVSGDCVKEGATNMKPLEVSGIDLELGTIPNSPTEELNKLLSLALKDSSKDNLAEENVGVEVDPEMNASGAPDASLDDAKTTLKGWLDHDNYEEQQMNIAGKDKNSSIGYGTDITKLDFPDTTAGLALAAIDIPQVDSDIIPSLQLGVSNPEQTLTPLNHDVATLDPSSSQHTAKPTMLDAKNTSIPESTLDPTVAHANKALSVANASTAPAVSENMLVDSVDEAENAPNKLLDVRGAGKAGMSSEDEDEVRGSAEEETSRPDLKDKTTPVSTSQKDDVDKDVSAGTSLSTEVEAQEKNTVSPASQSPVRSTAQHSPGKANISRKDDFEKGSHSGNGPEKPKRVPLVPKKPSSKIAAFQELLQRQQADQYSSKPFDDQHTSSSPTRFGGSRANFAQNLNGLFALPGMTPGNLPPVLAKKFAPTSPAEGSSSETKSKVATEDTSVPTSDIRTGRAKGPRGRKLPAAVASIEKVIPIANHQIVTFNTWSVVFNKPSIADGGETSMTEEGKCNQEPVDLAENSEDSTSNVNIMENKGTNSTVID